MRKTFSYLLIVWVGFACPILCGIRAEAGGHAPAKASCCKHGPTERDESNGPAAPQEDCPDRCFCSAHDVPAQKSEFLQPAYFVQPLECGIALILQVGVTQPLVDIQQLPPEAYRVLPLLI